jgi:hypothetical protein
LFFEAPPKATLPLIPPLTFLLVRIALSQDGHKHMSGLDEAVIKNVEACKQLSKITRTSLGPNGAPPITSLPPPKNQKSAVPFDQNSRVNVFGGLFVASPKRVLDLRSLRLDSTHLGWTSRRGPRRCRRAPLRRRQATSRQPQPRRRPRPRPTIHRSSPRRHPRTTLTFTLHSPLLSPLLTGMNKMVINHLDKLFVTSDAAVIVRELEVGKYVLINRSAIK